VFYKKIFALFFFFLGFLKIFDVLFMFCRKIFINFDPFPTF